VSGLSITSKFFKKSEMRERMNKIIQHVVLQISCIAATTLAYGDIYQWMDCDGDGNLLLTELDAEPGVDLSGLNLHCAYLMQANLQNAILHKAYLSNAQFNVANLNSANLSQADLTGADLRYANLEYAILIGTDLTTANLTQATFYGAAL